MESQTILSCGELLKYGFDGYCCWFRSDFIHGLVKRDGTFSIQYNGRIADAVQIPTVTQEALEFIVSECKAFNFFK